MDWEAILSQHPDEFAKAVGSWLLPAKARDGSAASAVQQAGESEARFPDISSLPSVNDYVGTIRQRLEGLNGESSKRLA